VARRVVPRGGNLAGIVALLFLSASPTHRVFATDIMLESLGAGLSLVVLYLYLRTVQQPIGVGAAARYLAVVLSILFIQKYNYWLLVAFTLIGTELLAHRRTLWNAGRRLMSTLDWSGQWSAQVRSTSNYLLVLVLLAIVAAYQHGDRPLVWNGRS